MVQHAAKRKTRSDKFPLTLHPTGQFCKKIKGKLYYFGTGRQEALQRYLEQAAFLHSGKSHRPNSANDRVSLKTLCNLYLTHQESRVAAGEIKHRQLHDQTRLLRDFAARSDHLLPVARAEGSEDSDARPARRDPGAVLRYCLQCLRLLQPRRQVVDCTAECAGHPVTATCCGLRNSRGGRGGRPSRPTRRPVVRRRPGRPVVK